MATRNSHPIRAATLPRSPAVPVRVPTAAVLALLCSGVAIAALPRAVPTLSPRQQQWQALAIAPLAAGGTTGMRQDSSQAVELLAAALHRAPGAAARPGPAAVAAPPATKHIHGRVGDGLYWSLRAAGASPQQTQQFLQALVSQIDVGSDLTPADAFDLSVSPSGAVTNASLDRLVGGRLELMRGGRPTRAAAAHFQDWGDDDALPAVAQPVLPAAGFMWPVNGRITSGFGWRYHPILHLMRLHKGIDFGASWGSPIVAAADGQVTMAGSAGGYGRQVEIAHAGGLMTTYSHMSQIVAAPGGLVHRGQLIGYVGSSGLSTGPHLHYEVLRRGTPVNPLSVRFAATQVVDNGAASAIRARLKALLSLGAKRG